MQRRGLTEAAIERGLVEDSRRGTKKDDGESAQRRGVEAKGKAEEDTGGWDKVEDAFMEDPRWEDYIKAVKCGDNPTLTWRQYVLAQRVSAGLAGLLALGYRRQLPMVTEQSPTPSPPPAPPAPHPPPGAAHDVTRVEDARWEDYVKAVKCGDNPTLTWRQYVLAPTARLFGYTGGLITGAQRSAFGQADLVLCDLFARLSQGKENSNPEEDAIEITEGWRNTQWPECMVTLPRLGPASAVDMKRMFEYSNNSTWQNFKTKSIPASASSPPMRALFPRETNPAKVEATLLQLAPQAKVSVTLPPHTILEAVSRLAQSHMGWLTRSDVSTWPTEKIAAALLERLHGAGLATIVRQEVNTQATTAASKAQPVLAEKGASRPACSSDGWYVLLARSTTFRYLC